MRATAPPLRRRRPATFIPPLPLRALSPSHALSPLRARAVASAAAAAVMSNAPHAAAGIGVTHVDIRPLSAATAAAVDAALMSEPFNHTLVQLMELAGLAVALSAHDYLLHHVAPQPQPPPCAARGGEGEGRAADDATCGDVVIVCGPGNNGGDGLVAARHLCHFGHRCTVVYPRRPGKSARAPFGSLLSQLHVLDVAIVDDLPAAAQCMPPATQRPRLLVDAIFGFSFSGASGVREPYSSLIDAINARPETPLLAVDVPSGWHVDDGNVYPHAVRMPDALVSLTAPKMFVKKLQGHNHNALVHYVGGRFVPPKLCSQLQFEVPPYVGTDQIMRLS